MRILRIIASADPRTGGPIEGLRISAAIMAEWGHETEVVTLDNPSDTFLELYDYPVHAVGRWVRKYGYTPALSRWVAENAGRFDVAVVHGLWNHASVGGWQGLRRTGLPYVVFTHGMLDPWFKTTYPAKHMAKQVFWSVWQGRVLSDAASVLFTSEEEKALAEGAFAGHPYKGAMVAYGAAEPTAEIDAQQRALREKVPSSATRPYLLYLSRIHPKKGCDLLVEAFAGLARLRPDLDLVIAGPDQVGLKDQLAARADQLGIGDRIFWPGMLEGDAKWGAFRGAEAFVLPSHQENFGIVVAEAMSCACPVLITDKVNIWREVAGAGAGLVQPDTQEGVSALLTRYAGMTPADRNVMGQAARACFERHFSAERAARDLVSQLEAAVA